MELLNRIPGQCVAGLPVLPGVFFATRMQRVGLAVLRLSLFSEAGMDRLSQLGDRKYYFPLCQHPPLFLIIGLIGPP